MQLKSFSLNRFSEKLYTEKMYKLNIFIFNDYNLLNIILSHLPTMQQRIGRNLVELLLELL